MLVLRRRIKECIILQRKAKNRHIPIATICVLGIEGSDVKIGVCAPASIVITREELLSTRAEQIEKPTS